MNNVPPTLSLTTRLTAGRTAVEVIDGYVLARLGIKKIFFLISKLHFRALPRRNMTLEKGQFLKAPMTTAAATLSIACELCALPSTETVMLTNCRHRLGLRDWMSTARRGLPQVTRDTRFGTVICVSCFETATCRACQSHTCSQPEDEEGDGVHVAPESVAVTLTDMHFSDTEGESELDLVPLLCKKRELYHTSCISEFLVDCTRCGAFGIEENAFEDNWDSKESMCGGCSIQCWSCMRQLTAVEAATLARYVNSMHKFTFQKFSERIYTATQHGIVYCTDCADEVKPDDIVARPAFAVGTACVKRQADVATKEARKK